MKRVLQNNLYMLKIVIKCCPCHIIFTLSLAVLGSAASVFNIYVLKQIIDSLSHLSDSNYCYMYIVIAGVADVLVMTLRTIYTTWFLPKNELIIKRELRLMLMEKALSVELGYYDDQVFYNRYNMAIEQSDTRAISVLNTFSSILSSVCTIGALSTLLFVLDFPLILFAFLGAGLSIGTQTRIMKLQHSFSVDSTPLRREMAYIHRTVYLKEYVQELNLHPRVLTLLVQHYCTSVQEMFKIIKKYAKGLFSHQEFSNGATSLVSTASMIYLALQASSGNVSIGNFIALESSSMQLFSQIRTMATGVFQLYDHSLYIENFRNFTEFPDRKNSIGQVPMPNPKSISLCNVSFKYSNNGHVALNQINLCIQCGEKIALVGHNGSGKTTLLKLLMRLHCPTAGEICLNGINIDSINYDDYLEKFGVILQDFRILAASIAENILMRPIQDVEADEAQVWRALAFVKLSDKVSRLSKTIYTPISREFDNDGAVFSGGELQRLAIARAYAKDPPILILDEPSSALDPISEAEIFDMLFNLGTDKTLILISHRLININRADRILVMSEGEIVEDGSPSELLEKEGEFAQLMKAATNFIAYV